jgi:integrase
MWGHCWGHFLTFSGCGGIVSAPITQKGEKMKLNDKAAAAAKSREKAYKLSDGAGLYLEVMPSGAKSWRLKYRYGGKEKRLVFGLYPVVSLKQAREWAQDARKLLAGGVDPGLAKKEAQNAVIESAPVMRETVEQVAVEWMNRFSGDWAESHTEKVAARLRRDVFPAIGKEEIKSITPAQLLTVIRRIESRGILETAHRILQSCGQIWRYAVACGYAERDITGDLRGALPPKKTRHFGSITEPVEIGKLLREIDVYNGSDVVRAALKLAPLVFVRPGELRQARWDEFDFEKRLWTIPSEKMKARRPHVVPLSSQVVEILEDLRKTHDADLLFPSPRSRTRPLSDVALTAALRRMGYTGDEMTAHGFRALASTNLEQLGYDTRLIELQLAHSDHDQVRAAYKRETHMLRLDERKKMMQHWADFLDALKQGGKVVAFKKQEKLG